MSTTERDNSIDSPSDEHLSREELRTRIELLEAENRSLKESYTRAKQTRYQHTALGLGAVGIAAGIGALFVPTAATVLFALAGIGIFGAVLTYYITPERFVSADVGRDVYTTVADNESALAAELGLSDERIYIPTGDNAVRLFVPHQGDMSLPAPSDLDRTIVVTDDKMTRGLALTPSGHTLFSTLEKTMNGSIGETPGTIVDQLTDALVAQFELVSAAEVDVDADDGRATVGITDSVYGPLDRFDHPVPSLLATGLAVGLQTPVQVEVTGATDGQAEFLVTCRW